MKEKLNKKIKKGKGKRRKIEEMNNIINSKIWNLKNEFNQKFIIKNVIIPKRIKDNILKTRKIYYNSQKIVNEIKESYRILNSEKRTKPKLLFLF